MSTEARKRRLTAMYNQARAKAYAEAADYYRTYYLSRHRGWRRWFALFDQSWVLEKIKDSQMMADAHAFMARALMGIEP